jgi:hypothetical protein
MAQRVKLGLHLKEDSTYTQTSEAKSFVEEMVQGRSIKLDVDIKEKTSFLVKQINGDVYNLEVRYKSLELDMSVPQGSMRYSSEKKDSTDIMSMFLRQMVEKPFYVKMRTSGKVDKVLGVDKLWKDILKSYPQMTDAQKSQIGTQMSQSFGGDAVKGNFEMLTAIYPDKPVARGEKWTISGKLKLPIILLTEWTTFEYEGSTASTYLIHGNSKMQTGDKNALVQSNGVKLRCDLSGTRVSDLEIDKKSGWIVSGHLTTSLQGLALIPDSPQNSGGMKIPIFTKNEILVSNK